MSMKPEPVFAPVDKDTLMCADYDVPLGPGGVCPECNIAHDMQSTYILKAGYPLPSRPKRVLIVDDDPDVRESLSRWFKLRGYTVYAHADGHGAFEQYRESYPFVFVLSDFLFIPGQQKSSCGSVIHNGAELVREIRKLIPKQRMAIISGEPNVARDSLDSSVKDVPVLKKPFRMNALEDLLENS